MGAMLSAPPRALLVMSPESFALQFGQDQLDRLDTLVSMEEPAVVHELTSAAARARLAEAEVLLTSWGAPALTPEVLAAAPRLRAVLHAAGSVRYMVTEEVHERGIVVSTAADVNAIPVAEYTLAAIIMAGKRVPFIARTSVQSWQAGMGRSDLTNRGRAVGIVGFSRIGRRVMDLLSLLELGALRVYDPYADPEQVAALGGELTSLDETMATSEILSVHAPALPETRGMIGARELALLPDGATVINTARGVVIDQEALTRECGTGRLYAILDVTDPEPLTPDHPLRAMDNVLITPHIAGSLGNEARRMSDHAIDELQRWLSGAPLRSQHLPDAASLTA